MRKVAIPTSLTKLLTDWLAKKKVKQLAESEFNKANTALKNAVKADLAANDATPGSFYSFLGQRIAYEVSVGNAIAPEDLMVEYEQGRITRDQFLRCISVVLGETANAVGGDVVAALTQSLPGKTPDMRQKELSVEEAKEFGKGVLVIPDLPKVKRRKLGATGKLSDKAKPSKVAVGVGKRKLKIGK